MRNLLHKISCCFVDYTEEFGDEATIDELRLLTVVLPLLATLLIGVAAAFDGMGG